MSANGFQISWLKERFAYDNAARNPKVEKAFLDHFRNHEKIFVVDIGSGTGANCLYFMERLFKNQDWTLIEKDAELCKATRQKIERFLQDYNFFYSYEENTFRIKVWESRVKIKILNASFFDLEKLVDLETTDVVMAAAVFDVLTFEQFEEILLPIKKSQTPLLTTMNYQTMRFLPEAAEDAQFIKTYENHMRRIQVDGKAMGPDCSTLMKDYFVKHKLSFQEGASKWMLDEKAKKMHAYLLDFMEDSLKDEIHLDAKGFEKWLSNKRVLSKKGELEMEVNHLDFFVTVD